MQSEVTADEVQPEVSAEQVAPIAEPVQAPPEQLPEPKVETSSLTDIEAKFQKQLEDIRRENAENLERLKQSGRDSTRERFDRISAELQALKIERQSEVRAMAKAGLIDPSQATLRLSEIDESFYQRELAEKPKPIPQPVQQVVPNNNLAWERYKGEIMDALDLTGREPEFEKMVMNFGNPSTLEEAQAKFKREAKAVRKAVDLRVNPKPKTVEAVKPPTLEVGGGKAITPPDLESVADELRRLNQKRDLTREERKRRNDLDKILESS
jgi:hypothetical protein